jgi:uncharacterized protein YjiS (DUF1127 family)
MTAIALIASSLHNSRLSALLRRIGEFFEAVEEAHEMAARYRSLSRLSNSELARMGIKREDIARVAIFGETA